MKIFAQILASVKEAAVWSGILNSTAYRLTRSTCVPMQPLHFAPRTVSPSQCPIVFLLSTLRSRYCSSALIALYSSLVAAFRRISRLILGGDRPSSLAISVFFCPSAEPVDFLSLFVVKYLQQLIQFSFLGLLVIYHYKGFSVSGIPFFPLFFYSLHLLL